MSHECRKCGDEFDSERGLSIHQSQVHDGKEDTTKQEEPNKIQKERSSEGKGVNLTVKQFGQLTFGTGLFLGLALGMMFGGFSGIQGTIENTGAVPTNNNDEGKNNPSGSNTVQLRNTEYPYGDLEAGIGSGERTYDNITFKLKGEPYIGSPDADITAVSYEDFECPFCSQYNNNAYPQIVENHVRTGEVQYFFKNLPLRSHPWAEPSSIASECALNQNEKAFWIFKQGFFNNQDRLGNAYDNSNFDESMYRWAEQTGLDVEQFKQCYDNEEELDEVREDRREAANNGAQATPTIIINEQRINGAQPYSRFQSTIQSFQ